MLVDKTGQCRTNRDTSENGRFFSFYLQKISRLKAIFQARKQDFKKTRLQDFSISRKNENRKTRLK
ncbi:MAG: hypothetical protein BHV68_14265 [Bacteroidales bacterium 43_8]|nr:MAG: hypothetical protein BHV68_14265 [Bacteroidales bacterium 43_8]